MNETNILTTVQLAEIRTLVDSDKNAKELFQYYLARTRISRHFTFRRLQRDFLAKTKSPLSRESVVPVLKAIMKMKLGKLVMTEEGNFEFDWTFAKDSHNVRVLAKEVLGASASKSTGTNKKANPLPRKLPLVHGRRKTDVAPIVIEEAVVPTAKQRADHDSTFTIKANGIEFQGTLEQWKSEALATIRAHIEGALR